MKKCFFLLSLLSMAILLSGCYSHHRRPVVHHYSHPKPRPVVIVKERHHKPHVVVKKHHNPRVVVKEKPRKRGHPHY